MPESDLEEIRDAIPRHPPGLYAVTGEDVDRALYQLRHRAVPPAGPGWLEVPPVGSPCPKEGVPPDGVPLLCWSPCWTDPTKGQFYVAECVTKRRSREWFLSVTAEPEDSSCAPDPTHWRTIPT